MKKVLVLFSIIFVLVGCNSPLTLIDTIEKVAHDGIYHEGNTCPSDYVNCE